MTSGLPIPPATLRQIVNRPEEPDWSLLTDAARMARQWKAYRGEFKRPLQRMTRSEPDFNVIVNRCEPIVSAAIEYLYGDEIHFRVGDVQTETPRDDATKAAQDYLDAVWRANEKMARLMEYEITSAVFGHGFLKLVPDDQDTAPYPSIVVLNPEQMQVTPDPLDVRKPQEYVFSYVDTDEDTGAAVERRTLTTRDQHGNGMGWTIRDQQRLIGAGLSVQTRLEAAMLSSPTSTLAMGSWQDVGPVLNWDYRWPPIHDAKNLPEPNQYWGKADLRLDLIHLNDVLNALMSYVQKIVYYHAHPKLVLFGVASNEIPDEPGSAICIPTDKARAQQVEMQSDLSAVRAQIDDIRESMDELSHYNAMATGRLRNLPAVPSGVALKTASRPMVSQTLVKRVLREQMLIKLCQHVLELGGYGRDVPVSVEWPEILPTDDFNEAQTAQIWQAVGASRTTLLKRGGFDPDIERENKLEEAELAQQQMQDSMPPPAQQPSQLENAAAVNAADQTQQQPALRGAG